MSEVRCPSCQNTIQEIDDGLDDEVQYSTDICPICGYNPDE
jgi:hypothetical protein